MKTIVLKLKQPDGALLTLVVVVSRDQREDDLELLHMESPRSQTSASDLSVNHRARSGPGQYMTERVETGRAGWRPEAANRRASYRAR